jgi:hypothetical protein
LEKRTIGRRVFLHPPENRLLGSLQEARRNFVSDIIVEVDTMGMVVYIVKSGYKKKASGAGWFMKSWLSLAWLIYPLLKSIS